MRTGISVKELITELLECNMDQEVCLKIKFNDTDLEFEDGEVGIQIIKTGGGWGTNTPYITLDLEDQSSGEFAEGLVD